MIRPTASSVSALSSIVANSRQTIHSFPPPPPKFRTAGFPQYGFKQAVSRDLHGPSHLYATTVEVLTTRVYSVVGLLVQAAREASDTTHPSSGPWLRQRLFCPPASSLTMATSELLAATVGLWIMPTALRPPEGPQFTLPEFDSVPPPLLRWLQDASREHAPLAGPSPILSGLGNHFFSAHQTTCGPFNEAATFT